MSNRFILTPFFLDQPSPDLESLLKPGWHLNKPALFAGEKQTRMGSLYKPLAQRVTQSIKSGERPVSLAGDCCAAIGVLAGFRRAGVEPLLIWFDAHGDFNTWETTPSGFLGGMPLAMLVGRGEQTILEALELAPLPESQVLITDARDLDPGERLALESSQVLHLPDPARLYDVSLPQRPLYVHFDTDIIDPKEAPAMSYPASAGPSVADLQELFRYLAATGMVSALSMSAWNPDLDADGRTQQVCLHLLDCLLGE